MSCSAIKVERMGFSRVTHLLLGNCLGICLPTGHGKWLLLHHLFCFLLSSSTWPSLIKQTLGFLLLFCFILAPKFSHFYFSFLLPPFHLEWGDKWVSDCVVLICPLVLTHNSSIRNKTKHIHTNRICWKILAVKQKHLCGENKVQTKQDLSSCLQLSGNTNTDSKYHSSFLKDVILSCWLFRFGLAFNF